MSFKVRLKDTSFHIFINSLDFISLQNACWIFFQNLIFLYVRKVFNFMEFSFLENTLIWGIFTHAPRHLKLAPKFLPSLPRQEKITHSPRQYSFENLSPPNSRKGWRKLWFVLSKFSQKIWKWLGTLGFLYFVWFATF